MDTYTTWFRDGIPAAVPPWKGYAAFNFVGGNIDPEMVAIDDLAEKAAAAMRKHGRAMAFYNMGDGPLGFGLLRDRVAERMNRTRGTNVTRDNVLITSGSGQGLDLLNQSMVGEGDTVIMEQHTYSAAATRLKKLGATILPAPLDSEGIDIDRLRQTLQALATKGVRPRFIFTIPTVQNPTGSILPLERRHQLIDLARNFGVPIIEDECYSELTFGVERPPSIYSLAPDVTIYVGSFSKTISPAIRLGYIIAAPEIVRQVAALKSDSGTSAMTQALVAEFLDDGYDSHIRRVSDALIHKLEVITAAVNREFGTSVEVERPTGGLFIWLTFPEGFDTRRLTAAADKQGIIFNAGADWSVGADAGLRNLRLCFAHLPEKVLEDGVAALAQVCFEEAGFPERGANSVRQ
ncbi:PLP-dependent aminotransferase family protein [Pseudooceanicola sp.]|uniref:aminotransferase-like domain-containing protein n=1 Tax=Pseudooceanicola sp. TaxID=1914328 RepID=UPI002617996D|nr:PLP-dependent aminotransferase family protein [Pseudooceanicola sp.]MDF1854412.1 PLP-dependent aminotransferase family protein [Pseudooceanicola sp.]